ncbi:MAG: hypothetical protein SH847_14575 [Roseiflexaceae bacterium]|nr:hypothetical protein [Roseiflexaceae bacterium]
MSWFDQMVVVIERAYEQRLKKASGLDGLSSHTDNTTVPDEDEGEIVNLPRGVAVVTVAQPKETDEVSE